MYDTRKILLKNDLRRIISKSDILEKASPYNIFRQYLGDFKIGKTYNSPMREDKAPSFGLFISNRDNELLYKDLATGECGDVFKFVKEYKKLQTYKDVYKAIYEDMNLFMPEERLISKRNYTYRETKITITRRQMSDIDLSFWGKFGISAETLRLYKVNSISKLFVNNALKDVYSEKEPMYAYKVFNKFKIYKPLSPKIKKWRGNLSSLDIQGFEQLPESGELLIITKSLKDVMVLYEMGYDAIAPASESTEIPEVVISNISKRFKTIVVFYDRDKTGMKFSRNLVNKYKFDFIFINKRYKSKDISDFVVNYSFEEAKKMLNKELKK